MCVACASMGLMVAVQGLLAACSTGVKHSFVAAVTPSLLLVGLPHTAGRGVAPVGRQSRSQTGALCSRARVYVCCTGEDDAAASKHEWRGEA